MVAAAPTTKPVPNQAAEVPPGSSSAPAWKWYGYGTPTPGRNPLAPAGVYGAVPGNWYTASGATPGAVPPGRPGGSSVPGLVPDPVPGPRVLYTGPTSFMGPTSFAAPDAPALPTAVNPQADKFADVDWSPSAAATLKAPAAETMAAEADAPPARLSAPVRGDNGPVLGPPVQPAQAAPPSPPAESPDIPIEPAKDILLPPNPGAGGMSRAKVPTTARAQAPDSDVGDLVRQACGPQ